MSIVTRGAWQSGLLSVANVVCAYWPTSVLSPACLERCSNWMIRSIAIYFFPNWYFNAEYLVFVNLQNKWSDFETSFSNSKLRYPWVLEVIIKKIGICKRNYAVKVESKSWYFINNNRHIPNISKMKCRIHTLYQTILQQTLSHISTYFPSAFTSEAPEISVP